MEKRPNYCVVCYTPTMGTTKCDRHKEGPKQHSRDNMSYAQHLKREKEKEGADQVYYSD